MSQAAASDVKPHRSVSSVVPFLSWIRTYDRGAWLRPDLLAGQRAAGGACEAAQPARGERLFLTT